MNQRPALIALFAVLALASQPVEAQNLLTNGNLDRTAEVEIVPGFFLPKPTSWQNIGTRSITGPYEDEMSSEPWAGPAPTPVTTDGSANPPHPEGCDGDDCAVFFKAFSGNLTDGPMTGHLIQTVPASPGLSYTLSGWAGAEANFLGRPQFALEFIDGGGSGLSAVSLDLVPAGLFTPNGEPFNYKQYTMSGIAPVGTVSARVRASVLDGLGNPAGGGQAFVVDDFVLTAVPEPSTVALATCGLLCMAGFFRRRQRSTSIGS